MNIKEPLSYFVNALARTQKNIIENELFSEALKLVPNDLKVSEIKRAYVLACSKADAAKRLADRGNENASEIWATFVQVRAFTAYVLRGRQA